MSQLPSRPGRVRHPRARRCRLDRSNPTIGLVPLEPRLLLSATTLDTHGHDDPLLHVMPEVDATLATEYASTIEGGDVLATATVPLDQTFTLHSNPGASQTIYLDFDGHVTSGTYWKGGATLVTPEYDIDGVAGFSDTELQRIQYIWQRVAEDFIAFDVNVTTEDPGVAALTKSGSGDSAWGVRVAIGGSSYDWYGNGAGGVAYVGSFNWSSDTPTFVFTDQLGNGNEKYTAEAISHEAGHTLGLSHDGTSSSGYYSGHGSGETGWAPIMGVGYYKNLVQWSKGEYPDATQFQDDLAIITSNNGFGYRADDHGSTIGSADALTVNGTSVSAAGIIERNTDYDVFSFATGAGSITLNLSPADRGANLDIYAELLNSSGQVVAVSNPTGSLAASISANVAAGTYYLRVSGTGEGDPSSTGYSDYGSIGQYTVSGSIQPGGVVTPSITINNVSVDEGAGLATFTVSLSQATTGVVSVLASTANGSASAGSDYTAKSQTITFNAGETSKSFTVAINDDADDESNETFFVNLSNASGGTIADAQGVGTIIDNDDTPPPPPAEVYISIADASADEADLYTKGRNSGEPRTTSMTFVVSLSEPATDPVTVNWSTLSGSATSGVDFTAGSGTLVFSAGQASATITVDVLGDIDIEGDETFTVQLSGATGATITDGSATGTIVDNDTPGGDGGGNGKGNGKNKAAVFADAVETGTASEELVAAARDEALSRVADMLDARLADRPGALGLSTAADRIRDLLDGDTDTASTVSVFDVV